MKVLLILYPIQPYVNVLIGKEEQPEVKAKIAGFYQTLIRKRYPGFQRVFALFSDTENLAKPNISQLWEGVRSQNGDIIGASGVTFENHCENKVYPKESNILALCPKPIDKLVIGGFHLWDCVDKTAKYAYRRGINVSVDEDLTELFFYQVKNSKGDPFLRIPISKKKSLEITRKQLNRAGSGLLEYTREARIKRPWLIQI